MEYKILTTIVMVTIMILGIGGVTTNSVSATDKSPYDSGYSHGCSDAQIENPDEWYINGVNDNGESTARDHHTAAFNSGYDAGFQACGGQIVDINQADDIITKTNTEINDQEQNQAASTTQNGSCGTILIGDCYLGQSSSNNFGANAEN